MQSIALGQQRPQWCIAGLIAPLLLLSAYAQANCPAFVQLPSGTTFHLARLVSDRGSPEAALRAVREAIAVASADGGCPPYEEPAACTETLAVAKKAAAALEQCTAPVPPAHRAQRHNSAAIHRHKATPHP
jgi:hypothetical protein